MALDHCGPQGDHRSEHSKYLSFKLQVNDDEIFRSILNFIDYITSYICESSISTTNSELKKQQQHLQVF